jgi:hypothetical protein
MPHVLRECPEALPIIRLKLGGGDAGRFFDLGCQVRQVVLVRECTKVCQYVDDPVVLHVTLVKKG